MVFIAFLEATNRIGKLKTIEMSQMSRRIYRTCRVKITS